MGLTILHDRESWEQTRARLDGPTTLAAFDYVAAAARLHDGEQPAQGGWAEAALWETSAGIVFHPYICRPIPNADGLTDLISAYEFGGIWCSPALAESQAELRRDFAQIFAAYAVENGIVSEFMRLHPFIPVSGLAEGGYEVRLQQEHAAIPLGGSHDEIRAGYAAPRRRLVRQGQRHGLIFRRSNDAAAFHRLFIANLHRLQASPFYLFPLSFIQAIANQTILFEAATAQGRPAAAHLYIPDGETLFAFLPHADPDLRELRPNDFLYDAVAGWALENGFRWLHLGGGTPELLRYKKTFGSTLHPYYQARRIFHADHYARLAENVAACRFFPAYRHPSMLPRISPSVSLEESVA